MGVKLKRIIQFKRTSLEQLKGKKLAVDAYNTIYQFLTTIRQYDGTPLKDSQGRTTSHLSGLFYRNANLLLQGVKPCYVFDGEPPFFKKDELDSRKQRKLQAKEEYEKALAEKDFETARLKASQATFLTDEMVEESKKLLEAMGIPIVQAPSEGEAQSAYMVSKGDCYAVASQDYDALLFGSYRLLKNVNMTGKRKMPGKNVYSELVPEIVELDDVLNTLGVDRNQLIMIAMLVGTDFNEGVKGVGPVKALKTVKEFKTFEGVVKKLGWKERNIELVYDFFRKPPVNGNYRLKFRDVNSERVLKIMVDEHNFSKERVSKMLKKIVDERQQRTQTSLLKF